MNKEFDVSVWQEKMFKLFNMEVFTDKPDVIQEILKVVYDNPYPTEINALLGRLIYKFNDLTKALDTVKKYEGVLYHIDKDYLHNKYKLPVELTKSRSRYHFQPPCLDVPEHVSNNHDLLLNVHHKLPQNYDFINKIQAMPWSIDPNVIIDEDRSQTGNYDRYLRVISKYLGEKFYFKWQYDKRGRSYSKGYDINLQGDEYHKAMLNLGNAEVLTNWDAMKRAIATHAGLDKEPIPSQIAWFNAQEEFDTTQWDEPILGRKALRAYQDALEGKPIAYWMSLDATASGLQIMSVISDDVHSGLSVNLGGADRHDIYQQVADDMNRQLPKDQHVTRADVKKPLMTKFYNSQAMPARMLNSPERLLAFEVTLNGSLTGPLMVMELLNQCWDSEATYHEWILPDGHVAHVPVEETATYNIEDDYLGDITFSIRERTTTEYYRSLCPNVIHSIDAYVARQMILRADFDLAHIHDCFVFHPNYHDEVLELYKEILIEINQMDLLSDIVYQLTGKKISCKPTSNLSKEIAKSQYALS